MLTRLLSARAIRSPGVPTDGRGAMPLFCLVLLVAASVSTSLVFACATPFAAFAVVAAAMLPLRPAVAVVAAAWLTNQLVGFGVLGYPGTIDAAAWGLVLGAATVCATVVASLVFDRLAPIGRFTLYPIAFLAAFLTYQLCLAAVVPVLGGADAFTAAIIGGIALTNVVWLIGLVVLCEGRRFLAGTRGVVRRREV